MNRNERLDQILRIISESTTPLTLAQIARFAGLRKTPYLVNLVHDLERDGLVTIEVAYLANNLPVHLVSPTARQASAK